MTQAPHQSFWCPFGPAVDLVGHPRAPLKRSPPFVDQYFLATGPVLPMRYPEKPQAVPATKDEPQP